MKAELTKDGILILRGETDEEKKFLKMVDREGIRNFGGGSYNTFTLPSKAGLQQFHFNSGQVSMLCYALGRCERHLHLLSYGGGNYPRLLNLLLSEIFKYSRHMPRYLDIYKEKKKSKKEKKS